MQVQDSANIKLENGQYKFLDWIEDMKQEGDRCKVFRSFPNFALKKIQFLERKQSLKNSGRKHFTGACKAF